MRFLFLSQNIYGYIKITKPICFITENLRLSPKAGVLKNFANFTGKHLCWPSGRQPDYKETLIQVFFCEICRIFRNKCFEYHLQTTASKCRGGKLTKPRQTKFGKLEKQNHFHKFSYVITL